jgi:Zn finger protein HypA/HybF involved in hydrogenase expression
MKLTYNCQHCGQEHKRKHSTTNKFCDNRCQAEYVWLTETKPRVLRGEITSNSIGPIKRFLIQETGNRCEGCNTPPMWNGNPLTLQVDHIDGNSENNTLDNLRLLCPNCHSQTPTHGNKGSKRRANGQRKTYYETHRVKQ